MQPNGPAAHLTLFPPGTVLSSWLKSGEFVFFFPYIRSQISLANILE